MTLTQIHFETVTRHIKSKSGYKDWLRAKYEHTNSNFFWIGLQEVSYAGIV